MDKEVVYKRFCQVFDYLISKKIVTKRVTMAAELGMSEAALSSALANKDGRFTSGFIKKLVKAYPELNEQWLLEGKGQMAKPGRHTRPHYDAAVSAGFMDGLSEGKMSAEFRAMAIPLIAYEFTIDVKGDSMLPRIEDGDVLMCRVAIDRLNPPIGKICVIDTKDGAVVKQILSVNEDTMTLHSLNPAYRDYEIDLSTILGVAEVVGLVRSFL